MVTDILMPDMDGIEVIMGIHKIDPGLPIIAMSGMSSNSPLYLETARQLGVHRTLAKPFPMVEFFEAVDAVLKGEP